jgi:sigma-B regulation protein RsbU (phosphoserine phosphatase)
VPASELAGDFYDVISISEHKIGFLIIDVMGHGVRSAIIVSLIRGLMEQAEHLASEPALYLKKINDELTTILKKASITLFASACYTLLDFECNKMVIVSAGHDFPMIEFAKKSRTDNVVDYIKGPALGIHSEAQYSEATYPLKNIKGILLFTDGIYEASNNDDQEWGIENLQQEFNHARSNHTPSSVDHIYRKATEWIGNSQFQDDVCLVNLEIV